MALTPAASNGGGSLFDADDVANRYIRWATTDGKGIGRATRQGPWSGRAARDNARARARCGATGMTAGNGTLVRAAAIGLTACAIPEARRGSRQNAQVMRSCRPVQVARPWHGPGRRSRSPNCFDGLVPSGL
jgi:hypothetical protein